MKEKQWEDKLNGGGVEEEEEEKKKKKKKEKRRLTKYKNYDNEDAEAYSELYSMKTLNPPLHTFFSVRSYKVYSGFIIPFHDVVGELVQVLCDAQEMHHHDRQHSAQ